MYTTQRGRKGERERMFDRVLHDLRIGTGTDYWLLALQQTVLSRADYVRYPSCLSRGPGDLQKRMSWKNILKQGSLIFSEKPFPMFCRSQPAWQQLSVQNRTERTVRTSTPPILSKA